MKRKRGQKNSKEKARRNKRSHPYTRKEMRKYLGNLSLIAFGSRGKWQKLAADLGLSIDSVKEQMEAIVNYMQQRFQEINNGRKEVRSTEAEDVTDSTEVIS